MQQVGIVYFDIYHIETREPLHVANEYLTHAERKPTQRYIPQSTLTGALVFGSTVLFGSEAPTIYSRVHLTHGYPTREFKLSELLDPRKPPSAYLPKGILNPKSMRLPTREDRIRMYWAESIQPFTSFHFLAYSTSQELLDKAKAALEFIADWGLGGLRGEGYGAYRIKAYRRAEAEVDQQNTQHLRARVLTWLPVELIPNPSTQAKAFKERVKREGGGPVDIEAPQDIMIQLQAGGFQPTSFINISPKPKAKPPRVKFISLETGAHIMITAKTPVKTMSFKHNGTKLKLIELLQIKYGINLPAQASLPALAAITMEGKLA